MRKSSCRQPAAAQSAALYEPNQLIELRGGADAEVPIAGDSTIRLILSPATNVIHHRDMRNLASRAMDPASYPSAFVFLVKHSRVVHGRFTLFVRNGNQDTRL